jgi:plastocyanin
MRFRLFIALLAVLTAGAVACGSGSDAPSCESAEKSSTVTLADFSYTPDCMAADAGATLHLDNQGEAPHTFTVEGSPVSVDVGPGEQADADLAGLAPGTYTVICTFHSQMKATLEVG